MKAVLTGGPGTGKSSVCNELNNLGYIIVDEVARSLISKYQEQDQSKLPWNDKEGFAYTCETTQICNFFNYSNCFFDRSFVDDIGYRNMANVPIPEYLSNAARDLRFDKIFFFPFWPEIYKKDSVRHESPQQAQALGIFISDAYERAGYEVLWVPKVALEDRVKFIIENIS